METYRDNDRKVWEILNDSILLLDKEFYYKISYASIDSFSLLRIKEESLQANIHLKVDKDQKTQPQIDTVNNSGFKM